MDELDEFLYEGIRQKRECQRLLLSEFEGDLLKYMRHAMEHQFDDDSESRNEEYTVTEYEPGEEELKEFREFIKKLESEEIDLGIGENESKKLREFIQQCKAENPDLERELFYG
ncbi:MAG: hypothetical protein H7A25_18560 [Leptospiraceae bacterium]|nr:hypothetical protein [Leptospiraceae bacterium]MCP5501910.1 hypothetical protein [Leptospiraceae bacterium]